jgi:hypothetical protein
MGFTGSRPCIATLCSALGYIVCGHTEIFAGEREHECVRYLIPWRHGQWLHLVLLALCSVCEDEYRGGLLIDICHFLAIVWA